MVELQECDPKLTLSSIDDGGDCRVYREVLCLGWLAEK